VIVNMVRSPFLSHADLVAVEEGTAEATLSAGLRTAGVDTALLPVLLDEASQFAARAALEERGRDALAHLARPTYELPLLADSIDLGSLYELATALKSQGLA
jgi:hypothetical protein